MNRLTKITGIGAVALLSVTPALYAQDNAAQPASQDGLAALDALEASLKSNGGKSELTQGPSANATVNLLRLLVKRGVVSHEDAVDLIRQAEFEASQAKAQSEAVSAAAQQIQAAAQSEIEHNEKDIRVTYIPDAVKEEIAMDVSDNVMARARRENWMKPESAPSWVSRLSLAADFRARYESIMFPSGNAGFGSFTDFNAINTGSPFDLKGNVYSPQLNATENRSRTRIRARFAFEADLDEGISMGARLATGSGSSPVSTNQTMGSPGDFSRYSIWLDRAYVKWQTQWQDIGVKVSLGRFANPFFSTEIIWDDDISMDGVAVELKHRHSKDLGTFLTFGAFPVFNSSLNFPSNQNFGDTSRFKSQDKYLFAIQGGFEQKVTKKIDVKVGVGYYHFQNVEGQLSEEMEFLTANDRGPTDGLRPAFAQKGNTYMRLRRIKPTPENDYGDKNQWQYFGLATPFHVLSATAKADFNHFEPFQISVFAEFIKNLGASSGSISANDPVNNREIDTATGNLLDYNGGNIAWIAGLRIGDATLQERWNWQLGVDYRYMESDSFIDGFVGSDFGLGGTNLKGITVGGRLALFNSTYLGLRWMSASEIAGPRFRSDIFQIDITTSF